MLQFDFNSFLFAKRLSLMDVAKAMKLHLRSVQIMRDRGTVKPSFLRKLETKYGDLSRYIIADKVVA